jgi:hypothetical protein
MFCIKTTRKHLHDVVCAGSLLRLQWCLLGECLREQVVTSERQAKVVEEALPRHGSLRDCRPTEEQVERLQPLEQIIPLPGGTNTS